MVAGEGDDGRPIQSATEIVAYELLVVEFAAPSWPITVITTHLTSVMFKTAGGESLRCRALGGAASSGAKSKKQSRLLMMGKTATAGIIYSEEPR